MTNADKYKKKLELQKEVEEADHKLTEELFGSGLCTLDCSMYRIPILFVTDATNEIDIIKNDDIVKEEEIEQSDFI